MKTNQVIVTSANSPKTIPISHRGGQLGVGATPAGAGNYTTTFTLTPLEEDLTLNPHPISNMTTATTVEQTSLGPINALIVTLHSGTSVTIDLTQSDV